MINHSHEGRTDLYRSFRSGPLKGCTPGCLLSAAVILTVSLRTSAQLEPPARPTKTTPVLFHGYIALSLVFPGLPEMSNSGRQGLSITHYPSGWGLGLARQQLGWDSEGPSITTYGWLGSYSVYQPRNNLTARNVMAIKEFHLPNSNVFRPAFEAGVSFIEYHHDEVIEPITLNPSYEVRVSHVTGFDARIRLFLALSQVFALEFAFHSNINPVQSYSSVEFGLALGMVRPPKVKKQVAP